MGTELAYAVIYGVVSAVVSAAVSWIFAPDAPDVEGPRMDGAATQTSSYGQPIKKTYGESRFAGNIIWSEGTKEHVHYDDVGGKGGDSGTQTTYTYSCSFAVGLCDNEIAGIGKIWADGKLIYDASVTDDYTQLISSLSRAKSISVYRGTPTQMPDPVMEAVEGEGNVPGYRNLAYIVFEDLELADFGNRIPNLEFEVLATGTEQGVSFSIRDAEGYPVDKMNNSITATYVPNGFAVAGEATVSYTTGADIGFLDGAPGSFINYIDIPNRSNTTPFLAFDDKAGIVYLNLSKYIYKINYSSKQIQYYQTPPYIDGTWTSDANDLKDHCQLASRSLARLKIKTFKNKIGADVLTDNLSSENNTVLKIYNGGVLSLVHYKDEADNWVYPDPEEWCEYTLEFDGVEYDTVEGGHITIDKDGTYYRRIVPIGISDAGDIIAMTWPKNSLFITDGYTTTVKRGYDYVNPYGAGDDEGYDDGFLGPNDEVYLRYGPQIDVCEPLSPYIYKAVPNALTKTSVSEIVSSILDDSGLASSEYDVSDLSSLTVRGYLQINPIKAKSMLQPLMQMFQFDVIEQDWNLLCRLRGDDTVIDIPYNDLGAREYGGEYETPLVVTQKNESELPWELLYQYYDYGIDYQHNIQRANRSKSVVNTVTAHSVKHPIVMESDEALQAVEKLFQTMWASRTSYKFSTITDYIDLVPGNVVTIDGENKMRISNISLAFPNLLTIEASAEEPSSYVSANTAETPYLPVQEVADVCPIGFIMMELPALDGVHTAPGFYLAIYTQSSGFKSAAVYRSLDDGTSWDLVQGSQAISLVGKTTTALESGSVNVVDEGNAVNVELDTINGDLSGTTDLSMFAGKNTAAIGDAGRWEIVSFGNVTQETDGTYTLSDLVRGRRGTEQNVNNHTASDRFILLEANRLIFIPIPEDKIGATIQYRVVSSGQSLQDATPTDFVCNGENLKPYSPAHITGARDADGNLTIDWVRRSRSSMGWNAGGVPIVEELEQYEIDIMDGGTAVRTIIVNDTTSYTYTNTDQVADFGATQSSVTVRIYQISATVGRGRKGEVTI